MSEKLDLVSLCCRAELETGRFNAYACTECGQACEAVRPDRRPAGFDHYRKEWKRKPVVDTSIPPKPLEGFTEYRLKHGKDLPT